MDIRPYLNRFVIIGSLSLAGILILITVILIGWTSPRFSPDVGFAPADLTMILAPTHTPAATVIPTIDPLASPTFAPNTLSQYNFFMLLIGFLLLAIGTAYRKI